MLITESMRLPATHVRLLDSLYEAEMAMWLEVIRKLEASCGTVICVGHNPAISCLASGMANRTIDLAPAGIALFQSSSRSWTTFDHDLREVSLQHLPA